MTDRGETRRPIPRRLWVLLAVLLVGKWSVILREGLAPRIWLDELFYFTTAFDMVHWGPGGAMHPQFLFYRPLLSAVTAPWHLLPSEAVPMTWVYRLSLLTVAALALATVIPAYRLYEEVYGKASTAAAVVVAFASPGYLGLLLLSESLFVPLYVAHLLFFARFILGRRSLDAVAAGGCAAAMVLTRPTGMAIAVAGLVAMGAEELARRRWNFRPVRREQWIWVIGLPFATELVWKAVGASLADPTNWGLGLRRYVTEGWHLVWSGGAARGVLLERMVANGAYVLLGSLGVAIPLAWVVARRPKSDQDVMLRLLLIQIVVFFILCNGFAAVHMTVFGGLETSKAKYHLYGRYVEYFIVPVLVLGLGALRGLGRETLRGHRRLLLLALLAVVIASAVAVLPPELASDLGRGRSIRVAPNHEGIAGILLLWIRTGSRIVAGGIAVAVVLATAWAWTDQRWGGRPAWRLAAVAIAIVPGLLGLWAVWQYHDGNQQAAARIRARLSRPLASHPALRPDGICVQWSSQKHDDKLAIYVTYFDHLPWSRHGDCQREYPTLPVLTDVPMPGVTLLRSRPTSPVRLVGPLGSDSASGSLFADDFESGTADSWRRE